MNALTPRDHAAAVAYPEREMLPPIARPVVEVITERPHPGAAWNSRSPMHTARCDHCPWEYGPTASKLDANERARSHRAAHRAGDVEA